MLTNQQAEAGALRLRPPHLHNEAETLKEMEKGSSKNAGMNEQTR